MHRYETNFIGLVRNHNGGIGFEQFSPFDGKSPEDLHSYIGTVMAGYQRFVDRLLDHLDEMLGTWCGIRGSRSSTSFADGAGNILRWAYEYGGYRNDTMTIG